MKTRKSPFDDRVWYDPKTNRIWIGCRDTKWGGEPWSWHIYSADRHPLGPKCFGPPKHFIEIGREPERSIT